MYSNLFHYSYFPGLRKNRQQFGGSRIVAEAWKEQLSFSISKSQVLKLKLPIPFISFGGQLSELFQALTSSQGTRFLASKTMKECFGLFITEVSAAAARNRYTGVWLPRDPASQDGKTHAQTLPIRGRAFHCYLKETRPRLWIGLFFVLRLSSS